MDEIEFRLAYNAAVNAAEASDDPKVKHALMQILQLINYLNERITELQEEVDDE